MPLGPGTSQLTPSMLAPPRMAARTATVRQQFDQRASRIGRYDVLLREIEARMFERLALIRIDPQSILDLGCGLGRSRTAFAKRYPKAKWIGVDLSHAMLAQHAQGGWLTRLRVGPRPMLICAEATRLPLAKQSIDLVQSNLMLHWHPQPHTVFPELQRILRVGGVLMFSCFGPDTLTELRDACAAVSDRFRPMPLVDMHDFGDMMVAAGFENPVMDAERFTLTYPSPKAMLAEISALGGNPRDDRSAALPSTRQARQLLAALDQQRNQEGRIQLTFEVAYGHAWKPAPRDSAATIGLDAVRAELSRRR